MVLTNPRWYQVFMSQGTLKKTVGACLGQVPLKHKIPLPFKRFYSSIVGIALEGLKTLATLAWCKVPAFGAK